MNHRTAMVLIVALFIISPAVAWLIYSGVIDVGIKATQGKNKGELVHPARPLQGFALKNHQGEQVTENDLLGLWTLVEFAASSCIDDCMKNIYKMRQIRLALGKDAHRVQRVVITEKPDHMAKLMADNPGTRLFLTTDNSAPLLNQFPGYSEGGISSIEQRIYIIDPLGNLMMRYPPNVDASDVLKDLRQLLKATWIRPKT
jgi:peroxiredoxin